MQDVGTSHKPYRHVKARARARPGGNGYSGTIVERGGFSPRAGLCDASVHRATARVSRDNGPERSLAEKVRVLGCDDRLFWDRG